ncbi:MAG: aldo/keto reductase [Thermoprotei archaeon]
MWYLDVSDRKPLGRTRETVPAVGIGTWGIRDFNKAEEALTKAIEFGLNMIDTAEMYHTEELVGKVIKRVGKENVFITTKLLPEHFSDVNDALNAARSSLSRLGINTVDLILIHWPRAFTPIGKQIRILEAIANAGYTRYIGVSNFNVSQLAKAIQSTKKHEIVVNQVKYSVLDRTIEDNLLPYAIEHSITIQAYTPLERGKVSNNKILSEIGKKYNKTPVQIALNYLISNPMVTAIPKTEKIERVLEFEGSLRWRLTKEDIESIRSKI